MRGEFGLDRAEEASEGTYLVWKGQKKQARETIWFGQGRRRKRGKLFGLDRAEEGSEGNFGLDRAEGASEETIWFGQGRRNKRGKLFGLDRAEEASEGNSVAL